MILPKNTVFINARTKKNKSRKDAGLTQSIHPALMKSSNLTQPGAKPCNTNAQRGTEAATSYIHARCTPQDKAGWVKSAQAENLKLTEWIVKTLNSMV